MRKNIIAAVVLFAVIFSFAGVLTSCSPNQGPPAMSIEFNGRTTSFSTNIYGYFLSYSKTRDLIGIANMFAPPGNEVQAQQVPQFLAMLPPDFWSNELYETIEAQAQSFMAQMLAIVAFCREHNLTLSSERLNAIDEYINLIRTEVFGRNRAQFDATLARFGINEGIFREIRRIEHMTGLVSNFLFDPVNGKHSIDYEDIWFVYENTFARFNHILLTTSVPIGDGEFEELPSDELAEVRELAQDLYNRISASGNDAELFAELIQNYSDDISFPPEGVTISEQSGLQAILTDTLFDMEIGDVRIVEADWGIHIMKRYELLPPDQVPDISSPGNTIANTLTTTFRAIILNQELAPFLENVTIHEEEVRNIRARTSDTMFDIWGWLSIR